MAAVELATAYVSIVPSTRGLAGQLRREVGGPLDQISGDAGRSGGSSFIANFTSNVVGSLDSLGGSIVESVSKWTKRAGVVGAGVLGLSLFGGLQRVLDTEDATIAFKQMGLSIQEIDRALAGVDRTFDGTPFANPQGFNISAQLLASGRDLNQIEDDLRGISNVTAQTLDKDLGRTADTFLRIAATGRAYAVDMNALALQGIPMRQILAEALNVTVSELNEMVTAGDITFDVMMDIINATERFDGAAQAMGSSTRGAFQNVLTGVSRLGQSFLGPLFGENGHAVNSLQAIRGALRDATPIADELGQKFAAWLIPTVQSLASWVTGTLVPAVQSMVEWFGRNRDEIGRVVAALLPALAALGTLAVTINLVRRAIALTPIGLVLALATALTYAYQNSETFRAGVHRAFDTVRRIIGPVVTAVTGWLRSLRNALTGSGSASEGMSAFGDRVRSVWGSIQTTFSGVVTIVESTLSRIRWLWDRFGGDILTVVGGLWTAVSSIFDGALQAIAGIVDVFAGILTGDWRRIRDGIVGIVRGLWTAVTGAFRGAGQVLSGLTRALRDNVVGFFSNMHQRLVGLVDSIRTAVINAFTRMGSGVVDYVRGLPGQIVAGLASLGRMLEGVARTAFGFVSGFGFGVVAAAGVAVDWVRGLPGRILQAVGDLSRLLYNAGRAVVQGLIDGIKSMVGSVGDAIGSVTGAISRFVPGSPVKEGPLMVLNRGYAGRTIVDMLLDGITQQAPKLELALSGAMSPTVAPVVTSTTASTPGAIHNHIYLDGREITHAVSKTVRTDYRGDINAALGGRR